ncbi:SPFH/Band 7/PHB domain protein [Liquorilactobacillus satsumensis]|uniref:SPFH domain-containing protein n=1 Tax=Liquorilactobacillus satsumensis TaxID=259059 RepID=UPI0021C327E2|nr:SPFH domain-containing protein [Liquorilactobacillus satsumensis]MCP9312283.1 SPFH/Band 7/PHB domain protein [Liquorilactobacillus satsumensis]MCP9328788.1 SPFH/Band 7/PHB domain protein [Liquorilactobacillus satsumensis]MCP9359562.1 SPFH/Band 7/PHB domain protein [Liquorilactobacillus satsumensis]
MFGFKIVQQNCQGLVETLGKYRRTVNAGLQFYVPLLQKIRTVNLAMRPLQLSQYSVITKDNADIQASVTLNYHVTDAQKYVYENTDSVESMAQLVRGHLRDIIGRLDLTDALGSTSKINADLAAAIGDLTNVYGINVDRVNIDELTPSTAIQGAMDKQLTADRERIATIAKAQGEAQNIKLTTDARNRALIETAQAQAEATKKRADAESYRIEKIRKSLADVDPNYFRDQSIHAFVELAQSNTNLVVLSKDEMTTLGQVPVIKKMMEQENN